MAMTRGVSASKTIGLDLSLTGAGVAVIDQSGRLIRSELVGSKPDPNTGDLTRFARHAQTILGHALPSPEDLIAIEEYAFSGNGLTRLAELGGIVKYKMLTEFGIPPERICVCHNSTLKKFLTGKGNAQKDLILMSVLKNWGMEFRDDNLADAWGLAAIGHLAQGFQNLARRGADHLTVPEREAVAKFKSTAFLWNGFGGAKKQRKG